MLPVNFANGRWIDENIYCQEFPQELFEMPGIFKVKKPLSPYQGFTSVVKFIGQG
jgi:hypothetical protein